MNDQEWEKLCRDAGWSDEEIEAARHASEQMTEFFGVINKGKTNVQHKDCTESNG